MSALVIDGNSKSLSVECCLETKMHRDVKLLYDVMADTIGYIQVKSHLLTDKHLVSDQNTRQFRLVQMPYFSCAEPNKISWTLERHWRDI